MSNPIVSGLIGGVIAVALTAYIANRVGHQAPPGQLRFGRFMWVLGFACLAFACFPIAITLLAGHEKEFWAKACLVAAFGIGGVYCLGEAAFVRGSYDQDGITFSSPWTGLKQEQWRDLESIRQNDWCGWYALKFRSGNSIRLSRYLSGHLAALAVARQCSAPSARRQQQ